MPPSTPATVTYSTQVFFSPRRTGPRRITHRGLVYCRRIVFAAVVSLFAATKRIIVAL
jgi:hypothetical protein